MSISSNAHTLTQNGFRDRLDDSLCTDEFEIIENDERSVDPVFPEGAIDHWSVQNSIQITPLIESLRLPTSLNGTILQETATSPLIDLSSVQPQDSVLVETSVLSGTLQSSSSTASADEDSLVSVLRSQSETKEMLEKTLAYVENLTKDNKDSSSLKGTINNLEKSNEDMKALLDQRNTEIQELKETLWMSRSDQTVASEGEKREKQSKDDELAALTLRAQCNNQQESSSQDKFLLDQLDVMCAKFLEEKERRKVAEDLITSLTSGDVTRSLVRESAVADKLREKSQQVDKLEEKVAELENKLDQVTRQLADVKSSDETKDEIIKVLKEDHDEGTRLINEKERQIDELERICRRNVERGEVNNI